MTTFFLIRHGTTTAPPNVLTGRMPGIHLSAFGIGQIERVGERLAAGNIDAVYSGPLERVQESAQILARRWAAQHHVLEALDEIDFGAWAGRSFAELDQDPLWRNFNVCRTALRIPGGEMFVEVEARVARAMQRLYEQSPEGKIALVTHGDVIRSAICHYLAVPLDLMPRFQIDLASTSVVSLGGHGPCVTCLNLQPGAA